LFKRIKLSMFIFTFKKTNAKVFLLLFIIFNLNKLLAHAGTLSCSVTTLGACTGTVILRMSGATDAHAELPSQSNATYAGNVVCCSGATGIGTSCSGTTATVVRLSDVTNAHAQQSSVGTYTSNACISVPAGGSVSIGYQASNCTGFDTTLLSMQASDNSHVGNTSAYTTKVCGTATGAAQALSFTLSTTTIYFGTLTTAQTRYASSTGQGDTQETEAHSFTVSTNAGSGYLVTVQGASLTSGANVVTPIGNTNTASAVGTSQFGMRIVASGGTGAAVSPYNGSGFAYAASATTTSQVANEAVGDGVSTTYSTRYVGNIDTSTTVGSYSTSVTYVVTANF
jgi:hypothetical protein